MIKIGSRQIGLDEPCFIIAEAGVNHNGDIELAKKLIDAAKEAGADAVKFQTFKAGSIVARDAEKAEYQIAATGNSSQYEMIQKLELCLDDFRDLKAHAEARGIMFLSTPFDMASSDLLESLDIPAYKMASGEITNIPLLRHVARKGRPVILSTGMAFMDEIKEAIDAMRDEGLREVIVLHCVTSYPAPMNELNLKALLTMMEELDLPIGYSDHSLGILAPVAAIAMGACMIEKHLTLDRTMEGPDHAASLEPDELSEMVNAIRAIESALGNGVKAPSPREKEIMVKVRKSIVASMPIPEGTVLTKDMLAIKRPGNGLQPKELSDLIGMKTTRALDMDEQLGWEDVE